MENADNFAKAWAEPTPGPSLPQLPTPAENQFAKGFQDATTKGAADDGVVEPGNIDLKNRPVVKNEDGSISTVRSLGVNIDGHEVLIPTVVNGKVVSDDEAVEHFKATGEHLGKFSSVDAANAYAEKLHEQQDQMYSQGKPQ